MKVLSQEDSDDLRRYLLGSLSEERRELIETKLLSDRDFHEELEAAEDDLIDEYLSGKLSEQERQQFEAIFPSTPERHHKIQFSRSFNDYLKTHSASDPQEEREATLGVLPAPSSTVRIISGVLFVTLLLLIGVVWYVNKRQPVKQPEVQPIVITVAPSAKKPAGNTVTQLARPQRNLMVHVQIEINISDYPKYQIELVREAESLLKTDPMPADKTNGRYVVNVPIDSNLLDVGDYGIKLSGITDSGEPEFKEHYYLQVIE